MGEFIPFFAILMVFSIPIIAIWTKHRKAVMEMQARTTAEKAALYATSNQELEDRVRVLERIVTDRGYAVATQIEALRDQRRVEARSTAAEVEENL